MPALKKIGAAALAAFGWTSGGAGAVTASYLQVAGGGGGAGWEGGGGGAGGYLTGTTSLTPTLSYTVVVGAGGVGSGTSPVAAVGGNGSNSSITGLTASVGGGGGGTGIGGQSGASGGSGGGGGNGGVGGAATSGQGNAGGTGFSGGNYGGGGGGGAGAVGSNGTTSNGGAGGNGSASSISGTSTTYAGGGGGSVYLSGSSGAGGTGGGGAGSSSGGGTNGTANLGGGGGGSLNNGTITFVGGNGGSGIVIISYAGAQQFGGGIVTSVGGNTIHTFLTSGTLSPLSSLSASYLIVAGGAGGGNANARDGGGGGAGGMLTGSGVTIDTSSTYLVTVGAGGATDVNGTNSTFSMVSTAAVGGGKGDGASGGQVGNGGSGGGSVYFNAVAGNGGTVGTGTSGQGNNGGQGYSSGATFIVFSGGGGGGAGAVGGNASSSTSGSAGVGGVGLASSISGTSTYYAGGGGGGCQQNTAFTSSYTGGAGGNGGGGAGATSLSSGGNVNGGNATANTGGGGGGAGAGGVGGATGGNGGSGIVIISYAGSTQQMAGGSVTITGGNVIHTFTSSGYLTPLTYYSNSLRFRSSASAYLNRTPTVASNRTTWTWSGWVKRGKLGAYQTLFSAYGNSTNVDEQIRLYNSDVLNIEYYSTSAFVYQLLTTQVFRDPAAWYHIVVAMDTTQATASNRIKVYVNGTQVTSFSTATYPAQNATTLIDGVYPHYISVDLNNGANAYFDGYQSNINFIDGQALTPNSFGTFNSYGVWQPINYGGSYGTNGFYLPFNSGSETYAAQFNGSSQYLSTTATGFNASTGTWTIEGWAYCTNSGGNDVLLLGQVSGTDRFYLAYGGTTLYLGDVASNNVVASNAKPLNQWFHWAAVKNGSTYTVYINGIAVGSSTTALASYSLNTWLIGARPSQPGYLTGYMSNVRVNTTTAVYTSNFVPSTSPLTAISGTQLLTLQNATFVDNSTNNYTITNNGSMANPATGKPLSTAVFLDQSPQGNNWTPNNISGATGSTLDYMTDVPTLTSTTAANYATLNPLLPAFSDTGSFSISAGNLFTTGSNGLAISTIGVSSGKFYFEFSATSSNLSTIGIWQQPFNYAGVTYQQTNYRWYGATGSVYNTAGTILATYATWTAGDVLGVALDMDSGTLKYYKNGTLQGTPVTGLTGTWFFGVNTNSGSAGYANFGQQPFVYTPPSGYVALNTYNL